MVKTVDRPLVSADVDMADLMERMASTTNFSALLLSHWLLPLVIVAADRALFMAAPPPTMLVMRPYREWDFVREQLLRWSAVVAVLAQLVATIGLWAFCEWAVWP